MASVLVHRGPDDGGVWTDPDVGLGLGHRRLSIIDTSSQGHQPMLSPSGRYVLVFNGEIYNFPELRRSLGARGYAFRGHSDTEVLLAATEEWGLDDTLERSNGMFAFAIWDRTERQLHLARDRLGEKPLFYAWAGETFLFGSELKALRVHPSFQGEIDREALALYFRLKYVPAPRCIYRGAFKLPPASMLTIRWGQSSRPSPVTYWSARKVAEEGTADPMSVSSDEAREQLEGLLRDAVRLRMMSDVPLGAFLSGGIDSSTVVALMQSQSARPVRTFSIGLPEFGYNEAEDAKRIAAHLDTDHSEFYVTAAEAMSVIPRLSTLYDEPFSDSSQIPTFLVSSMARQHVKVCLSGDGGDELFGGYNRHIWAGGIWDKVGWMPRGARAVGAGLLTAVPPRGWEVLFRTISPFVPRRIRQRNPGDKVYKLADVLTADTPEEIYGRLASHWRGETTPVVLDGRERPTVVTDRAVWPSLPDLTRRMMYWDLVTYLPDDILQKLDRASMGVSLEARVPLLDHRVVEFAWRLPLSLKIRSGEGKWLLRQVLYRYVPKALIERPKMGFGVPIDSWLRDPLRDWATSLLDSHRLRQEGFLNPEPIRARWEEHLSGRRNWQYYLWDVLMFESWLETQAPRGLA